MAQADSSAQREQYTIGFGAFVDANMRQRSLASAADFLVPYLRPGMRLLDVGCGPGAITLGLAEVVAPGEVVGLDVAPLQVERAQALAEARHVPNVRFEQGDAYALPFPDAAFDAVFASALLMHLRDPLAALREFRRVLRPGGIAAVKDRVGEGPVFVPSTPLLAAFLDLFRRVEEQSRGRPQGVLHLTQRRLLREAGFDRTEAHVSAAGSYTAEGQPFLAGWYANMCTEMEFRAVALDHALADAALLDMMAAELRTWAARDDAVCYAQFCAALGWVNA
jgi:ubiquinone/menaquinone biosynthesis C-methylase UbiE